MFVEKLLNNVEISEESYVVRMINKFNIKNNKDLSTLNKTIMFKMIMDLKFRGIYFDSNTMSYKTLKEESSIIKVKKNGTYYKHIDFELYGLQSLLKDFEVNDDRFFDGIYLNALKLINSNASLNVFKLDLLGNNFNIIDPDFSASKKLENTKNEKTFKAEKENKKVQRNITVINQTKEIDKSTDDKIIIPRYKDSSSNENEKLELPDYSNFDEITFYESINLERYKSSSDLFFDLVIYQILASGIQYNKDLMGCLLSQSSLNKTIYNSNLSVLFNTVNYISDLPYEYDIVLENVFDSLKRTDIDLIKPAFDTYVAQNDIALFDNEEFKKLCVIYPKMLQKENSDAVIKKAVNRINDLISKREKHVIVLRTTTNQTLEEIGNALKVPVTRERIRQLESSGFRKLRNPQISYRLKKIFSQFENKYWFLIDFQEFLNKEDVAIFRQFIIRNNDDFSYDSRYDVFTLGSTKFTSELKRTVDLTKKILLESDLRADLEQFNKIHNTDMTYDYFVEQTFDDGYFKGNGLFYKKGLNIYEVYAFFIKKYIGSGYHRKGDYAKLISILDKYGFNTNKLNDRNVFVSLERHPGILLTKPLHIRFESFIPNDLYNKQKKYSLSLCKREIEKFGLFDAHNISEDIPTDLQFESNLHIYSIVRKFYREDFNFGSGNLLTIFPSDSESLNRGEEIKKYIVDNGGSVSKKSLMKDLNLPEYTINQTINSYNYLTSWGDGDVYYIDQEKITNNQSIINEFKHELDNFFSNNEFINRMQLFELASDKYSKLLDEFLITNNVDFLNFVDNIFDDYKRVGTYLLKDNSDFKIIDIIKKQLPDFFTRDDFYNIMRENSYAEPTIHLRFTTTFRNKIFYQIEDDLYCRADVFNIDEHIEVEILDYFNRVNRYDNYIIVENHIEFINNLNYSVIDGLNINIHVAISVLSKNGYHKLLNPSENLELYALKEEIETLEELINIVIPLEKIASYAEFKRELELMLQGRGSNINIDTLIEKLDSKLLNENRVLHI